MIVKQISIFTQILGKKILGIEFRKVRLHYIWFLHVCTLHQIQVNVTSVFCSVFLSIENTISTKKCSYISSFEFYIIMFTPSQNAGKTSDQTQCTRCAIFLTLFRFKISTFRNHTRQRVLFKHRMQHSRPDFVLLYQGLTRTHKQKLHLRNTNRIF